MTLEERLKLFAGDPKRGAEYFGHAAHACVLIGEADEAGARARIAAAYAKHCSTEPAKPEATRNEAEK